MAMSGQTAYESLLVDLTTSFARTTAEKINDEILKALQGIRELFQVQRIILIESSSNEGEPQIIQQAYGPSTRPLPSDLRVSSSFPWCCEAITQGQRIRVNSLQDFPPDAARDRMSCQDLNIAAILATPHYRNNQVSSILAATVSVSRIWPDSWAERMHVLGEIIVSAWERERTIQHLLDNERNYRLIVENIPALLCYIDRDQRFVFVNQKYAQVFNLSVSEIVGRFTSEIWGQQMYNEAKDRIDRVLSGQLVDFQTSTHTSDQPPRHYAGLLVPDISSAGDVLGFYSMLQDITKIKDLERESRHLRDRLAHLDRVAILNVLASSLVHEINQPLSAILSNTQAALRYLDRKTPDLQEILQILLDIESDDKRATEIINRVRHLVRKEKLQVRELLNLKELIQSVLKMTRKEFTSRNSRISTDINDDLPFISADWVQIQQVFINLLLNALEAVQHCPVSDRLVQVSAWNEGSRVCFSVTDFGPGIDPAMLESVFDLFTTSKRHGVGLGLAICNSIIKDHEGRIWAELPEDKGSRVVACLPAESRPDK